MVSRVRNAISALVIVQGTIVVALIKSKVDHHHEKKKENRDFEKGLDIATVSECWPLFTERDWIKQ